jgi:hypothetical protein
VGTDALFSQSTRPNTEKRFNVEPWQKAMSAVLKYLMEEKMVFPFENIELRPLKGIGGLRPMISWTKNNGEGTSYEYDPQTGEVDFNS